MTTTMLPPSAPPEAAPMTTSTTTPPTSLDKALEAMSKSLSLAFVGPAVPAPGDPVVAAIRPQLGTIEAAEILTGKLDLTWITKDVVYKDSDLHDKFEKEEIDKATVTGQTVSKTGTIITAESTPGVLATLRGTIPFATSVQVPVSATVTWDVLDANDKSVAGDPNVVHAPNGLSGTELAVLLAPALVRQGDGTPPATYKLKATVTLSANGRTAPPVTRSLEVRVPALELPTVLATFVHSNFQPRHGDDEGAALVVVPPKSPLGGLAQLQALLDTLQAALGRLSRFARFASFLVGVNELASALTAHPSAYIQFRETDAISNLNTITLVQRGWLENDTEAEDELSSIILLGFDGTVAEFFEERGFKGQSFKLRTKEAHLAIMRTLHGAEPPVEFGDIPEGKADGLGDKLSGLTLSWAPRSE